MPMTADSPLTPLEGEVSCLPTGWGGAGADVDVAAVGSESVEELASVPPSTVHIDSQSLSVQALWARHTVEILM